MTRCTFCGNEIDSSRDYRKVQGWERKATASSRKSGSDIRAREPVEGVWACRWCVDKLAAGVDPSQEALL
jgi:hypothetical protein